MPAHIALVGSANVDFVMKMPRLPDRGETVSGGSFSQAFGGKGSNQAMAAQRAGALVHPVISLGNDSFGQELREIYRKEGMDIGHVRLHDGEACGTAIIQVDDNGDNTIAIAAAANGLLSPGHVRDAAAVIASSNILMLQMEIPDDALQAAVSVARDHSIPVMLNLAPCRETRLVLDPAITYLVVNETEASVLTGLRVATVTEAREAAARLAGNGHRLVVVTLGSSGSLVFQDGAAVHYPAYTITPVDATAAGDSYAGALAVGLAEGMDTGDAIRLATAAGALSASRFGAMPSIPTRQEIDAFIAERRGSGPVPTPV